MVIQERKVQLIKILLKILIFRNPQVGLLYSRFAVAGGVSLNTSRQGICPKGWHIPSIPEFTALKAAIRADLSKYTKDDATSSTIGTRLLLTQCTEYGEVTDAKSKASFNGGFGLVMPPYGAGHNGTSANGFVFELACHGGTSSSFGIDFFAGSTRDPSYAEGKLEAWPTSQPLMVSIRCMKNQ